MQAVAMIVYNTTEAQLELTKAAVASVFAQDVPVHLWVIDNGSTDGTFEWLRSLSAPDGCKLEIGRFPTNQSPLRIANHMMSVFYGAGYDQILGVPNDVELPTNLYSQMLKWPRGIVTASMTEHRDGVTPRVAYAVSTNTPMAVAMIRKWVYDALMVKDGYFWDERFFHYASDLDMALRIAACGIAGIQLDIQYFHSGSASWRLATPQASREITSEADVDRAKFIDKWGFSVTDDQYGRRCGDINFKG